MNADKHEWQPPHKMKIENFIMKIKVYARMEIHGEREKEETSNASSFCIKYI